MTDVWLGQAEFLTSEEYITGLFTGAGYGKSHILCERVLRDISKQDNWWAGRVDYNSRPLLMVIGAPHEKYLSARTVPEFKAATDRLEAALGRTVRRKTGRNGDGWFGGNGHRRQEMGNAVDVTFYPLPTRDSAVAVDVAGFYVDEVTMLTDVDIWRRSLQRVRDSRAISRQVAVVGTPEEDHFIKNALIDEQTGLALPGVRVITDTSINNPKLPIEWFVTMGQQASESFKRMQVLGEWVAGAGGQRFAHLMDLDTVCMPSSVSPRDVRYKFSLGWDPGYRTGSVVIIWRHPSGVYCVVDEIVIRDLTTEQVCDELLARGYNMYNIEYIGLDPRDATKRTSTNQSTNAEIIYRKLKVRPKYRSVNNNHLLVRRLDVIANMLAAGKIVFAESLRPRTSGSPGIINGLRNFATKRMQSDDENFTDKPTHETLEKWKHYIDAISYVLMQYEKGEYQKVSAVPRRTRKNT